MYYFIWDLRVGSAVVPDKPLDNLICHFMVFVIEQPHTLC